MDVNFIPLVKGKHVSIQTKCSDPVVIANVYKIKPKTEACEEEMWKGVQKTMCHRDL